MGLENKRRRKNTNKLEFRWNRFRALHVPTISKFFIEEHEGKRRRRIRRSKKENEKKKGKINRKEWERKKKKGKRE